MAESVRSGARGNAIVRAGTALVYLAGLSRSIGGSCGNYSLPLPAACTKRNVIVFLSDDVGYGKFGFQGNNQIPTPNIDGIAKNGVRFTSGYVPATYCGPCRAGLLTGRYPTPFVHEFNGGGPKGLNNNFGLSLAE